MCGIVGVNARRDVAPILLTGLKRLEYRGYDSAGLAVLNESNQILRHRALGKVSELIGCQEQNPLSGHTGIAHTRWATHGVPAIHNAHPHLSTETVAVVHNGIIENFTELKQHCVDAGYAFDSETDTEVIAHLFHHLYTQTNDLLQTALRLSQQLHGAYALAIIHQAHPDMLIAIRRGSPLVIGLGIGENFIASDSLALLPVTREFIYLAEGDIALVGKDDITIYDKEGMSVERDCHTSQISENSSDKGPFRHFMQKEIFEQSDSLNNTIQGRLTEKTVLSDCFGREAKTILQSIHAIKIIACGTSYNAGLVAGYWLEQLAHIKTTVEIASEFRYREPFIDDNTLCVFLSQSGETADTLAALEVCLQRALPTLAICNVAESSLVRQTQLCLMTNAGPEIGVASTKAFTSQLVSLLLLTLSIGQLQQSLTVDMAHACELILSLPRLAENLLQTDKAIEALAQYFQHKQHTLFLGRGVYYPIALEGALKLKELSYINAQGYPAGELKHGPLALVDEQMPIVIVMANDNLVDKLKANIAEVHARRGELYIFADENITPVEGDNIHWLALPAVDTLIAPIVYSIPLQLLSYHVAVLKGTDVDQPRNLAKSVTVE